MNNDINSNSLAGSSSGFSEAARRVTGVNSEEEPVPPPPADPEVDTKASRRRFTAKYKCSILDQADLCKGRGEIGALLRREGLFSSHLTNWRKLRDTSALEGAQARLQGSC